MRTSNIVIVVVVLHAAAGFMAGTGMAADLGVYPNPGAGNEVDSTLEDSRQFAPANAGGGTLFGLIVNGIKFISNIFGLAIALPLMLSNMGVPDVILGFVFLPLYAIIAYDLVNLALRADLL